MGDAMSKNDRETLIAEQQRFKDLTQETHTPVQVVTKADPRANRSRKNLIAATLGIAKRPTWCQEDCAPGEEAPAGEAPSGAEDAAEEEEAEDAAEEEEEPEAPAKEKPPLSDFTVKKVLGKGAFATVYKVTQNSTSETYAMKVMDIRDLKTKGALARVIDREKPVLEQVDHPFIVGLMGGYVSKNRVYLVMEYCPGGDLKSVLNLFRLGSFPEAQARFYTAELILALECLHQRGIIYRDLKPENVLLDVEGHIRLTDFGLVKKGVENPDFGAESFLGTPLYLSPEMVAKAGHGQATDWWGLGIMLFEMLTGDAPFQGQDGTIEGLFTDIQEGDIPLHRGIHPNAMACIRGLLQKDPAKRFNSSHLRDHIWFASNTPPLAISEDWDKLLGKDKIFQPPYVPTIKSDEEPAEGEETRETEGSTETTTKKEVKEKGGPCGIM